MENKMLIFIGEMSKKAEVRITRKPGFSDAALLSQQSPQLLKNSPYQTIRLSDEGNNSICFCDKDIQITYHPRSLEIIEENRELSEEEVLDVVTNFILKEGNRFTVLGTFPNRKEKLDQLKKGWKFSVQKKIT
jgi:hypothetical protein